VTTVVTNQAACDILNQQVAASKQLSVDIISLDRTGIDARLRRNEDEIRGLAAATPNVASRLRPEADLLAQARPVVDAQWGDHDGIALHQRAYQNHNFRVVPEALFETGGRAAANRWGYASADASTAIYGIATSCHALPGIPARALSSATAPAPLPVLAVDLGTQHLVRVGADGSEMAVGPSTLQVNRPALSVDRSQLVAATVSSESPQGAVTRVLTADGQPQREIPGTWDCWGWLTDSEPVVGSYQGDLVHYQSADHLGTLLPFTGAGDCPVPAGAGKVLLSEGVSDRERSHVVLFNVTDGRQLADFRLDDCDLVSPAYDANTGKMAFAANCSNPLHRGIWIVSQGGQLTHVLTCVCGSPTFSPDGAWLAFAVVPPTVIGNRDARLGFAHADGMNAFYDQTGSLSFPIWPPTTAIRS
jgi:hypothetical protein